MKYKLYNKDGEVICITIIDKEYKPILDNFYWYLHKGYVKGKIMGKYLYLHRLVMNEENPNVKIDHINNNPLDNRKDNLRKATSQQNSFNRIKAKGKSSKYKGVSFDKHKNKWQCYIKINQVKKTLGYFDDEKEAAKLYDLNAKILFKNFALLNFN